MQNQQVTLSHEHAKLVMQALDLAVRQQGLNGALQLLPIAQEIEKQLTATQEI